VQARGAKGDKQFEPVNTDRIFGLGRLSAFEHYGRNPKSGELCPVRAKSGETLMEARYGTDVQIVHISRA